MKKKLIFLLIFIFLAFSLNFIWENLHFPLYAGNTIGIDNYWFLMIYASFVDAFWITAVYLLISIIDKTIKWELNKVNLILFSIFLLSIAIFVEKFALATGRWSYSRMPVIFSIGISPLIQLVITGLLSLFLTRKTIR